MAEKLSLQRWIRQAQAEHTSLYAIGLRHQTKMMEITAEELLGKMSMALKVMEESIQTGLLGKRSKGGLVGGDALRMQNQFQSQPEQSVTGPIVNRAVTFALAVGEANACMGRIVAAPTAGASGVLPGVLFALAETKGFSREELVAPLLVAGMIGMVIAERASLSGASGGCQAECGSAAAMAAGAIVSLLHGSPEQIGDAAAIALKNMLGLVCDPVAGLVEVPCVKRNAGAAAQALVAAEMALAGIKSVIPVDQVIDAMGEIGRCMHTSLKETAQGGLAVSPAGLEKASQMGRCCSSEYK
ncbi:MAG: L-serine dehydratase, iron-sulfur-dependent, alpha subunit [Firmicutes bacterium]|nr:L-serine dehydratase, iron-sulfur-dependent, alpha subunit [Bacillota bacterium]